MADTTSERWMTARQVREYLSLSHGTFYRLLRVAEQSGFPDHAARVGSSKRWRESDIRAWQLRCESGEIDLSRLSKWLRERGAA